MIPEVMVLFKAIDGISRTPRGTAGRRSFQCQLANALNAGNCPGMSVLLAPGDKAPDFTAIAVGGAYGEGREVSLSDFAGQTLVLYFYPKDDTPGCTTQACALRDRYRDVIEAGATVFGVSVDSPASHTAFIGKHGLPFPLLSDEKHQMVEAFGVWVEKSLYGKTFMGTERSTFVIGPDGRIKSVFRRVKPDEHVDTVLEDLKNFEP
jgi:peroxiredoxin Q/BCP